MTDQLIPVNLDADTVVLARVSGEAAIVSEGTEEAFPGLPSAETAADLIGKVGRAVLGGVQAARPSKVSVGVGLEVSGKTGWVISEGAAKGALTVTFEWDAPTPAVPEGEFAISG